MGVFDKIKKQETTFHYSGAKIAASWFGRALGLSGKQKEKFDKIFVEDVSKELEKGQKVILEIDRRGNPTGLLKDVLDKTIKSDQTAEDEGLISAVEAPRATRVAVNKNSMELNYGEHKFDSQKDRIK